jgi:hypothetical protein
MPTRVGSNPGLDLGVLVRRVVVHNHMDVQIRRHRIIDVPEEREEFLVPVTWLAFGQDLAIKDVEGCEQGGCAWRM